MKFIDANILLYAVNIAAPEHPRCRDWLSAALLGPEPIGLDWVVILAFLRISTRTRAFEHPLSVAQAIAQVNEWLSHPNVNVLSSTNGHWDKISSLLIGVGTGGNLTTDAHLAALAISHDATLVSCDSDFARFPGLKWENPLAAP